MKTLKQLQQQKVAPAPLAPKKNGVSLGIFNSAFDGQPIELIALFRGNKKIGEDFIQLSVLPLNGDISTKSEGRYSICGSCPHHLINSCYAVDQGLFSMLKQYKMGKYEAMPLNDFLSIARNRKIRFGRFGDLSLIPFEIVDKIARSCSGFTGYTNQWRSKFYDARFNTLLMLSTLGTKDSDRARERFPNARQFKVIAQDKVEVQDNSTSMTCSTANGYSCSECMLCNGTSGPETINITIQAHGLAFKSKNIATLLKKDI